MAEGRERLNKAERRQRNIDLKWNPENNDRGWHKYARCFICRKTFVVNNFPDRKVRMSSYVRRKKIICPFCRSRGCFEWLLDAMILFEQTGPKKRVKKWKKAKLGSYAGGPN